MTKKTNADAESNGARFENVVCLRETDRAILARVGGRGGRELWIPKSQLSQESEVFDVDKHSEGTLVVTEWFARKSFLYVECPKCAHCINTSSNEATGA